MNKIKSSSLLVVGGIFFVLVGVFCLMSPLRAYVNLVHFSGIVLLLNGIILQVSSSYAHLSFPKEKMSMRLDGILDMIFGILLVFNPFLSFILFPLLIGSWIFCKGVMKIIVALILRNRLKGWKFILVLGILFIVFSLLVLFAPLDRARTITTIIGGFFICLGAVLIYDSYKLRRMHETIDLLF